jgi:hypothetical protein
MGKQLPLIEVENLDIRVKAIEKVTQELGDHARKFDQSMTGEARRQFCLHEAMNFHRTTGGGILSAGAVIALADEFDRYVVHGSEGMPDAKAEKLNTEALVRAVVDRAYPTRYREVPQPITINSGSIGGGSTGIYPTH